MVCGRGQMSDQVAAQRDGESRGAGRVLVAVYSIFAVAATSRAAYQIATDFDAAPLAYLLSAFAALVYLVAAYGFATRRAGGRRAAFVACATELVGVLAVGTLSLALPEDFPDATVWSVYGRGYFFVPVVLPVLGLLWLRRNGVRSPES
jgi:hypothetical protein